MSALWFIEPVINGFHILTVIVYSFISERIFRNKVLDLISPAVYVLELDEFPDVYFPNIGVMVIKTI